MVKRSEVTEFLNSLLEKNLNVVSRHFAKEVTVDYGSVWSKRIDYMEFVPENGLCVSGIEKGIFVCYEVKSCRDDVFSGKGLNFLGEKNYIVTTMQAYKQIEQDIKEGGLNNHIRAVNPESSLNYGIIVAVPDGRTAKAEHEKPTPLDSSCKWHLQVMKRCQCGLRKRSTVELLFCMLRSR